MIRCESSLQIIRDRENRVGGWKDRDEQGRNIAKVRKKLEGARDLRMVSFFIHV